eukprot:403342815
MESGSLDSSQQMKAHTKTFLKILKNDYIQSIKQSPILQHDFNTLIHKYAKYKDDPSKIKKIYKRVNKLFIAVKSAFPKSPSKSNQSSRKQSISSLKNGEANKKRTKSKKSVKFNDDVQMREIEDISGSRTWNDHKKRNLNKGKFEESEVKILMNAICSYVKQNDLGEEGLIDLCSKSKEELSAELKGAWCKIAESMQNRSVQSCHNFCRRKFNPNNYNGKWTEDEELMLIQLSKEMGHVWKEIAQIINGRFNRDSKVDQRFGRTAENVKDKWKQLGGDNIDYRKKGPWTIEEAMTLVKAIQTATNTKFLKKSKTLHYKFEKSSVGNKVIKVKEDDIYIYDKYVDIGSVLPHLIKKNRCKKVVPTLQISWTAISNHLQSRSYDDIRNFWNLKVLPLLVPIQIENEWTQEEDIQLLQEIVEADIIDPADLDFEDIGDSLDKSSEGCRRRWEILLKGIAGVPPGKRINIKQVASQIIKDIETKHERYIPYVGNKGNSRNGSNSYINIVDYYKKNFA